MGQNLEELEAIVKLCRKTGILYYRGDGFEFRLSKSALLNNKKIKDPDREPRVTGVLTPEQMLHYSSLPPMG